MRDSTGMITAKLLAEKAQSEGRRDHGRGGDQHGDLRQRRHAAAATRPTGLAAIAPQYRDPQESAAHGWAWTCGARRSASTPSRRPKRNMPKPETWKDLTKPVYKGQIVMPHPASSGTGYLRRDRLAADLSARRTAGSTWTACTRTSRSTCTRARARARRRRNGEYVVGISFEYRANTRKGAGQADRPRVPEGRPGLGPRGHRHLKGTQEPRRRARS